MSTLITLGVMLMVVPPLAADQAPGQYVRSGEVVVKLRVCAAVLVPGVRLARSLTQRYLRRKFRFDSRALVVGTGPLTRELIHRMRQSHAVGVLDDTQPDGDPPDAPYLGTTDVLDSAVRETGAAELVVDVRRAAGVDRPARRGAQPGGTPADGRRRRRARIEHLGGVPLLVLNRVDPK